MVSTDPRLTPPPSTQWWRRWVPGVMHTAATQRGVRTGSEVCTRACHVLETAAQMTMLSRSNPTRATAGADDQRRKREPALTPRERQVVLGPGVVHPVRGPADPGAVTHPVVREPCRVPDDERREQLQRAVSVPEPGDGVRGNRAYRCPRMCVDVRHDAAGDHCATGHGRHGRQSCDPCPTRGPHEPRRLAEDPCDHHGSCDVDHDLCRRHLGDQLDGDHGAGGSVRASQRAATELASAAHATISTRTGAIVTVASSATAASMATQDRQAISGRRRSGARAERTPETIADHDDRDRAGAHQEEHEEGGDDEARVEGHGLRQQDSGWWRRRGAEGHGSSVAERGEGHHRGSPPNDAGGQTRDLPDPGASVDPRSCRAGQGR